MIDCFQYLEPFLKVILLGILLLNGKLLNGSSKLLALLLQRQDSFSLQDRMSIATDKDKNAAQWCTTSTSKPNFPGISLSKDFLL